jgi:hypothetical protein
MTCHHPIAQPHASTWLSILVPVYKVEAYLQECAQSILVQAVAGVEIIFLDDASPDGSAALLKDLQQSHPHQVSLLRHDFNQGISAARNALLKAAQGEHIWFIDADDILEAGALAKLKHIIDTHSPDLVLCDFRRLQDHGDGRARSLDEHIATFQGPSNVALKDPNLLVTGLFQTGQWHPWTKIVRRSVWPSALAFPEGRIFEDLAVFPRLVLRIQSFYHAQQVWMVYRQRPGSALSGLTEARMTEWMQALAGYANEIELAPVTLSQSTRFEIAHFGARTFIRAAKKLHRYKTPSAAKALSHFANLWQSASPLSTSELILAYLARGRLLRALQFMFWMRLSQSHLKTSPPAVPPQA